MKLVLLVLVWGFVIPAMRGARWAYAAFSVLGLLYIPASNGFSIDPQHCDLKLNVELAVLSLSNYPHIVIFAFFFLLTTRQLHGSDWRRFGWATAATMMMGALLELAQALSGNGHCRTRDLIPDAVGALLGLIMVFVGELLARQLFRGGHEIEVN